MSRKIKDVEELISEYKTFAHKKPKCRTCANQNVATFIERVIKDRIKNPDTKMFKSFYIFLVKNKHIKYSLHMDSLKNHITNCLKYSWTYNKYIEDIEDYKG